MVDNVSVKDAGNVSRTMRATDNTAVFTPHINIDSVPADPFGLNADAVVAAGAAGSMQAKLRRLTTDLDAVKTAVQLLDNAISGSEMQVDVITSPLSSDLAAVKTAVELIDNAIAGTEMQVDVVAPLPAGTNAIGKLAANSGVDIGDVDVLTVPADPFGVNADVSVAAGAAGSIQAKLRRLTADLGAVKTAVELIDNAIAGTEMQVDVVAALPAGTNAIGKLAANTGVDIGDVDILSVIPGVAAASLGKAEDAVHSSGDTGVMALAVRQDAQVSFGIDGDYVPLSVDSGGAVRVTGGGGGTEYTEDAPAAANPLGNALLARRRDTPAAEVTADGDMVALNATNKGEIYVKHVDTQNVTVSTALPAGTNAVGKLSANSGVDIGDVDVTSINPGTGASSLGKAEDAVHGSGDTGVMALAVRQDVQADFGADGDYVPLSIDGAGAVRVTGGGGGTEYNVNDVAPADPVGKANLMERDDALSALTEIEGDWTNQRATAEGALWTQDFNSDAIFADTTAIKTAVELIDNAIAGTEMQVDVVAPLPAGTNAIGKLAANTGVDIGDVDVLTVPADPFGVNADLAVTPGNAGSIQGKLRQMSSDINAVKTAVELIDNAIAGTEMQVDIVAALPAGTNAIGKLAVNSGVDIGDVDVLSLPTQATADAAAATVLDQVGLMVRTTDPSVFNDGDAVAAHASTLGKQVVLQGAVPSKTWSYASPAAVTDTVDDVAKAAGGAGVFTYVTGIQVFNGHDTVGTEVVIKDGSTVKWRGWAEQTGGGCSAQFNPPLKSTANTAINVANIANGSSTYFNLQGYEAAE